MMFSLQLKQFAEKAKGKLDLFTNQLVFEIASEIMIRSPFKTGLFRGNWTYSLNAPFAGVSSKLDPGGASTLATIKASIPQAAFGKVHYLVNNLPYAIKLENGYSKQAPLGIVGLTVAGFEATANRIAMEIA